MVPFLLWLPVLWFLPQVSRLLGSSHGLVWRLVSVSLRVLLCSTRCISSSHFVAPKALPGTLLPIGVGCRQDSWNSGSSEVSAGFHPSFPVGSCHVDIGSGHAISGRPW